jgi:Methyltransferase domain
LSNSFNNIICPLCSSESTSHMFKDDRKNLIRDYFNCKICDLIFVDEKDQISIENERARYDTHKNSMENSGYVRFLSRLMNPMLEKIKPGDSGLDFGSGPGPTLSLMFKKHGYSVNLYDPFYAPDRSTLNKKYEFIVSSEVFEHLNNPHKEIILLWSILKPGGILGVMTQLSKSVKSFPNWYYKNDDTHISFFSHKTFEWIAKKLDAKLKIIDNDVVLLEKKQD